MSGESSTTRIVALGVASCVESMEWGSHGQASARSRKLQKIHGIAALSPDTARRFLRPTQASGFRWLAPVQSPLIPPLLHASNRTLHSILYHHGWRRSAPSLAGSRLQVSLMCCADYYFLPVPTSCSPW